MSVTQDAKLLNSESSLDCGCSWIMPERIVTPTGLRFLVSVSQQLRAQRPQSGPGASQAIFHYANQKGV
jgi:hypothetical protein